MRSIDRRRALPLLTLALTLCAAPGCFQWPTGPAAPNTPSSPEPSPKVEVPKGKNALPKQAISRPID